MLPPNSLCVDLGSSGTKVAYGDRANSPCLFRMSSAVSISLQPEQVQSVQNLNFASQPENCAWIKRSKEIRAVGTFAENFVLDTGVKQLKESRAVDKILAAIGVMVRQLNPPQRKGFQANSIPIRLGVVLPLAEFSSREAINLELTGCTQFDFCKLPIAFKLVDKCLFLPEGVGIWKDRCYQLKKQKVDPSNRNIVVLMLGHRNASILVFQAEHFQKEKSTSAGPGFTTAIDAAYASRSFQPADQSKIFNALVGGSKEILLAGADRPVNITEAVELGINSYWGGLERFLKDHLNPCIDDKTEIVIAGGASQVVSAQLKQYFVHYQIPSQRVIFHKSEELSKLMAPSGYSRKEKALQTSRFGDVYGMYMALSSKQHKQAA